MVDLIVLLALGALLLVALLRAAVLGLWPDSRAAAFCEMEIVFGGDGDGCDGADGGGD